jgi:hypothetical protein
MDDTDPAALEVISTLYARMTAAPKLQRVGDLTEGTARLALAGLRARHPEESVRALLLWLARLRLGDELVDEAYPEPRSTRDT